MKRLIYHLFILLIALTCQSCSAEHSEKITIFKAPLYHKYDDTKLYFTSINVCGKNTAINLKDCMIDTGSAGLVLTYADYKQCLQQGIISENDFVELVKNRASTGEMMLNRKYRVKAIEIGNVRVNDVIVTFFTSPKVQNGSWRLIGIELLKRFSSVSLDMSNKTLIMYK